MTAREALQEAERRLKAAGVPDARLDAEWLLADVSDLPRLKLLLQTDRLLGEEAQARFFAWVSRRENREPLQYILGSAHFMGHEFLTQKGVLIPRADTEALCERAIGHIQPGFRILDLCCGTGCLGISLKLVFPGEKVWLSDLSGDAVSLAKKNAALLKADVRVLQGDLFQPFKEQAFDLILSNPPYIPSPDLQGLQPEVRWEPPLALDGGPDGLEFYRRILGEAKNHLNPGGILLLEIGDGEAEAVSALLDRDYQKPALFPDLAGRTRVLETRLGNGVH